MTLTIQVPEQVEVLLRAAAAAEGKPLEEYAANLLRSMAVPRAAVADWLDADYHAECEADTSPEYSLEAVREALSKIPGSMTADFISERDER